MKVREVFGGAVLGYDIFIWERKGHISAAIRDNHSNWTYLFKPHEELTDDQINDMLGFAIKPNGVREAEEILRAIKDGVYIGKKL